MEKNEKTKAIIQKYVEAETVTEDSENSSLSNFTDVLSENLHCDNTSAEIIIIEPFYGGSHKQLVDILTKNLNENFSEKKTCLFLLPGKKWHWRARTSALYFSRIIPKSSTYKVLFCTSVLNLTELIALRLDLSGLFKVIYFHENQLVYPVRKHKDRDFQYGYNQILSSLVADFIIFNSYYNMNSFLQNIDIFLKLQPDFHVKNLAKKISPKCKVIYFPVEIPQFENIRGNLLHIIWPHRWEHDKNPQLFFDTLFKLKSENIPFKVSVLGETFQEEPEIFQEAKKILQNEIIQFGRIKSKDEYYSLLRTGHVVVSTAFHEFFGVAMLEAVMLGCFPLACKRLVYPELYPKECLYNTPNQLYKKLKTFCEKPYLAQVYLERSGMDFNKFSTDVVMKQFRSVLSKKATLYSKLSLLSRDKHKTVKNDTKGITCLSKSKTSLHHPLVFRNAAEIDILHKTIEDLQKKIRERDQKIEALCEKYLYLKTNKNKMESDLRSKIQSLEKQLNLTYYILTEFQNEVEAVTEKSLSRTKNTFEALFLQEKSRCSKLMYEKIKLHHEIKRLEDVIRRLKDESGCWKYSESSVDKSTSEPFMRHSKTKV